MVILQNLPYLPGRYNAQSIIHWKRVLKQTDHWVVGKKWLALVGVIDGQKSSFEWKSRSKWHKRRNEKNKWRTNVVGFSMCLTNTDLKLKQAEVELIAIVCFFIRALIRSDARSFVCVLGFSCSTSFGFSFFCFTMKMKVCAQVQIKTASNHPKERLPVSKWFNPKTGKTKEIWQIYLPVFKKNKLDWKS